MKLSAIHVIEQVSGDIKSLSSFSNDAIGMMEAKNELLRLANEWTILNDEEEKDILQKQEYCPERETRIFIRM